MRVQAIKPQAPMQSQHSQSLTAYVQICCLAAIKVLLRAVRQQSANLYAGIGSFLTRVSGYLVIVNKLIVWQTIVKQRNLHSLINSLVCLVFKKTEDSFQRSRGNSVFSLYSSKMRLCVVVHLGLNGSGGGV
jgi:hypothetical protein